MNLTDVSEPSHDQTKLNVAKSAAIKHDQTYTLVDKPRKLAPYDWGPGNFATKQGNEFCECASASGLWLPTSK